jgi:hypothetical protein
MLTIGEAIEDVRGALRLLSDALAETIARVERLQDIAKK